jgi:AsmA protein
LQGRRRKRRAELEEGAMKAVKIVLAVVAACVALLVVAAVLVATLFDPNDYKGLVTDAFAARTGRTLAVERDLELSFFPWLAVETGGLTIGNARGFDAQGTGPFATVERVAARVKLVPLLVNRELEIGTVELDGLRLNLARDAALRGNWQDLLEAARGSRNGASIGPAQGGGVSADSFAVEGVQVRGGTVLWRENTNELRYTVSNLDLTTGAIGRNEPVAFAASFDAKDEASGLAARLEARATAAVDEAGSVSARGVAASLQVTPAGGARARELSAQAASVTFDRAAQALGVDGLTTETAGVRAAWTLSGSALLDNPTVQGTVAVAGAPLAALFEQLDWEPPQGVKPSELGTLDLQSGFAFRAEPREIRVSKLSAAVLGMSIAGEGALSGKDELAGTIRIPEFAPNAAVQSLLRASVPPKVDVSALDKLALSARFAANLTSGRASIADLDATVLGAAIKGNLDAVPGQNGNVFRGSVSTSRFAPDAFAKAFAAMLPPKIDVKELGNVRVDAKFTLDTAADTVVVAPFEAELFGISASGDATGRGVSKQATWTGRASVAQFSPQALIQRFGLPPQPASDPKALTRATIATRFVVDSKEARLEDLVLALDDSKLTGNFAIVGFNQPAYRFTLAVDRVDADRYLPPKARDAKKGQATAGDIKLPENNTMRLDGTMQIGSLALAGMQFDDVGARVLIGDGNARLEGARARLYGGTFAGNFRVQAAGDAPSLALDGKASGLKLEPLIQALTGHPANFSGTGAFDLDLKGTGRTVIENVQTAAGNVSFEMTNGAIKGFNVGSTICSAYNTLRGYPAPAGGQPDVTVFEAIQGSAVVTAGSARSNDLLARTSYMDVSGRGTLGLVDQALDYEFDAKLTNGIPIRGCQTLDEHAGKSFPLTIRGTVTQPDIKPDFSKLIQRVIREGVQDKLKDALRDRIFGR